MTLPFQTTLRWATEADFDALADVMFAAVREGESPYTEAQRQAWVPEPRRGSAWRTRLLSQEIIVAEADGRLLGFMSLADGGYIDFAYIRSEARGAGLFRGCASLRKLSFTHCHYAVAGLGGSSCFRFRARSAWLAVFHSPSLAALLL